MEVGPTTHYIMGGIRVDADTQESTVPGLFAAGECAAGINGANRLGGNSLSDLIVFGKRAANRRRRTRRERAAIALAMSMARRRKSARAVRRGDAGNPYKVQQDLQDTMQELVGIVRKEAEMQEAVQRLGGLKERASRAGVAGHREYHTGWHACLDLRNLLTVSEAIARSAIERKKAAAATSATTIRTRPPSSRRSTSPSRASAAARCRSCGGRLHRCRPN